MCHLRRIWKDSASSAIAMIETRRAGAAKRELEILTRLRMTLQRAKLEIAGITKPERRTSLTSQWVEADTSIREVAASIHAFNKRRMEERLSVLNAQTERLVAELAKR